MFHTHQSPQKFTEIDTNAALQMDFVPIRVSTSTYTGSYIYLYIYLTGAVVAQVYVEKRKADTVTCTAKRMHFKSILLQDTSVKERCNMRQYPEGVDDILLPS